MGKTTLYTGYQMSVRRFFNPHTLMTNGCRIHILITRLSIWHGRCIHHHRHHTQRTHERKIIISAYNYPIPIPGPGSQREQPADLGNICQQRALLNVTVQSDQSVHAVHIKVSGWSIIDRARVRTVGPRRGTWYIPPVRFPVRGLRIVSTLSSLMWWHCSVFCMQLMLAFQVHHKIPCFLQKEISFCLLLCNR